jgi:heme exporter protein D
MEQLKQFFYMGGYAFYVWSSFGVTFIVLLLSVILPWQRHRLVLNQLKRKLRRENS